MSGRKKGPAQAGALQVELFGLAGTDDLGSSSASPADLQVMKVLRHYDASVDLARAIADVVFSSGRRA